MKVKRAKNESGLVELRIPLLNLSKIDFDMFSGSVVEALVSAIGNWISPWGDRVCLCWGGRRLGERRLYGIVFSEKGFSAKEKKRLREWVTKTWVERFELCREIILAIKYLVNRGKLDLSPKNEKEPERQDGIGDRNERK